ncbi:MAG: Tim44/TimA family putative adaptor protein [Alphaproteobacteria bacterium]|nr:Tim44/TimA family putative adaptor protein [Alphaproteobacteria bacterium]
MAIENLILGGIVLFLIFILYKVVGNQQKKQGQLPDKLRFFSEKTGQIIEMKLIENPSDVSMTEERLNDEAFLLRAKIAFQQISESFSGGQLNVLKTALDTNIYSAFEEKIKERQAQNQTVDFSIVCFDSAKIVHKSPNEDKITVQFVTEQINVLKDEAGNAIEGDPMSISTVKDVWTFKKMKKNKWLLCATQSEGAYE